MESSGEKGKLTLAREDSRFDASKMVGWPTESPLSGVSIMAENRSVLRQAPDGRRNMRLSRRAAASTGLTCMAWLVGCGRPPDADTITIPVDSAAFLFSPGNWVGDDGRSGKGFRQTWNPGAYFRVAWESETRVPPTLLLDTSTYGGPLGGPTLAYCLDGIWCTNVRCAAEIPLAGGQSCGRHHLTVFLQSSIQQARWGSPGVSGANVLRVTGLRVGEDGVPVVAVRRPQWALIVGDSITEGIGASNLECYSYLLGEALMTRGYEYGVSACGWSGWLHKGDQPPGDVPGYYVVRNSVDGAGGEYADAESRWNKIDANHSLIDSKGRISATGAEGEEPALILINYGTNDVLTQQNRSDVRASISQCLVAVRKSAPDAHLVILIPFGQYLAAELWQAVAEFQAARPGDRRISLIDLGLDVARELSAGKGHWGDLHPTPRGHATFAARIIPQLMAALDAPQAVP